MDDHNIESIKAERTIRLEARKQPGVKNDNSYEACWLGAGTVGADALGLNQTQPSMILSRHLTSSGLTFLVFIM